MRNDSSGCVTNFRISLTSFVVITFESSASSTLLISMAKSSKFFKDLETIEAVKPTTCGNSINPRNQMS